MNLEMENNRLRFYQWDTGQRLIVDDDGSCGEVHFASADAQQALVCRVREENGVRFADVPNILLQNPVSFTAYLFGYTADGTRTQFAKSFVVCRRPKPEDYVYTETEVQSYKALDDRITMLENADAVDPELIAASVDQYMAQNPINPEDIGALPADHLPEAINDALTQAEKSGAFKGDPGEPGADGKTPVKGVDYFTEADKQEIAEQAAELVEVPSGIGGGESEMLLLADVDMAELAGGSIVLTELNNLTELYITVAGVANDSTTASNLMLQINGLHITNQFVPIAKTGAVQYAWGYVKYNGLVWMPETSNGGAIDPNNRTMNYGKVPYNHMLGVGKATSVSIMQPDNGTYAATTGTVKVYGR